MIDYLIVVNAAYQERKQQVFPTVGQFTLNEWSADQQCSRYLETADCI
jgi:hypothetical protein